MNRPKALNALTHEMSLALDRAAQGVGERSEDRDRRDHRRRRPRLLRRRRHPRAVPIRAQGPAHARVLLERIPDEPADLPLSEAVRRADGRHHHGRRRRRVGAGALSRRDGEDAAGDAGNRHRPLPRCRRELLPVAHAGPARRLSRPHRQPHPGRGHPLHRLRHPFRAVGEHGRRCVAALETVRRRATSSRIIACRSTRWRRSRSTGR